MTPHHLRQTERWIASVRLGAVRFAVVQVVLSTGYPPGYLAGRVDHHRGCSRSAP